MMGTNFYWLADTSAIDNFEPLDIVLPTGQRVNVLKPEVDQHHLHIGKRSVVKTVPGGVGLEFTWCCEPWVCLDTCYGMIDAGEDIEVAEDEYGARYTPHQLMELINNAKTWRLEKIGKRFC